MKRILLMLACFVLVTGAAHASSIFQTCSNFDANIAGGNGSNTATCAGVVIPLGATVTGVKIYLVSDYQGGQSTGIDVRVTFTPSTGSFAVAAPFCDVTGAASSTANSCGAYTTVLTNPGTTSDASTLVGAALTALATGGFNVNQNSALQSGGPVTGSSAGVIEEVDFTPEPMTMVLSGAGLLAVGLLARKRRKV